MAYEVLVFFVLLNPKAHSPEYFAWHFLYILSPFPGKILYIKLHTVWLSQSDNYLMKLNYSFITEKESHMSLVSKVRSALTLTLTKGLWHLPVFTNVGQVTPLPHTISHPLLWVSFTAKIYLGLKQHSKGGSGGGGVVKEENVA